MKSRLPSLVEKWAGMYAESLGKVPSLVSSGAVPCAQEMADGWHRWQITLRSKYASQAVKAWRWISAARPLPKEIKAYIDVDAFNVM